MKTGPLHERHELTVRLDVQLVEDARVSSAWPHLAQRAREADNDAVRVLSAFSSALAASPSSSSPAS
ncbi:hypothetical protein PF002_g27390 [Phytophthora fragariae]|uniref:Uncharacterized protein n=1 Tax=Phytophthora fragariae TaxID=53985 RepID=A0A6A3WF16_9STRA|nr:hypothetical protein PF009_g27169 [Phytophthora fragariae]KAE9181043.1 hypothetical protein PF002_g27390 [Phytophthora fragariae]KAE9274274.1 hypothetical protein PF001_g27133 [Phytophthora fragariae]